MRNLVKTGLIGVLLLAAAPAQAATSLLDSRVEPSMPAPDYRDCLFGKAGVQDAVARLDQLDRDMLFMRAGEHPIAEFRTLKTETSPAIPYSRLLPAARIAKLLMLIKSRAPCP